MRPFQREVILIKAHRFLKWLEGKLSEHVDRSAVVPLPVRHDRPDRAALLPAALIAASAHGR